MQISENITLSVKYFFHEDKKLGKSSGKEKSYIKPSEVHSLPRVPGRRRQRTRSFSWEKNWAISGVTSSLLQCQTVTEQSRLQWRQFSNRAGIPDHNQVDEYQIIFYIIIPIIIRYVSIIKLNIQFLCGKIIPYFWVLLLTREAHGKSCAGVQWRVWNSPRADEICSGG